MRAENRHYTFKWKKRRKEKHGHRCRVANCQICHYEKVHGIPSIKLKRENERSNSQFSDSGSGEQIEERN